jgi:hypothetical protein
MKDPRTWNRRDFAVTSNGYFTVLKPTGWFSTVRLPGGFRYLVGQSKGTTSPQAHGNPTQNPAAAPPPGSTLVPGQKSPVHADSRNTALPLQFTSLGAPDRRLMRPALIVLAATAITWILLLCLALP